MVFDPDNYNFRLDAGSLYSSWVSITGGAGFNAVAQVVNPAASGFNARVVAAVADVAVGGVMMGFDTAALGGVVNPVQARKSGGAAGVVTVNAKTTAVTPGTVTSMQRLNSTSQGVIGFYGASLPLVEITPNNQLDFWQTVTGGSLILTIVWIEVTTGVV